MHISTYIYNVDHEEEISLIYIYMYMIPKCAIN